MRSKDLTIGSWQDFQLFVDHLSIGSVWEPPYVFRGHANEGWDLKPTLLRILQEAGDTIEEEKALDVEVRATDRFSSEARSFLTPNEYLVSRDSVGWWSIMQHYGAPTRLLDWTASVYVAAYFAVREEPRLDGAIWQVHVPSVHERVSQKYGSYPFPTEAHEKNHDFLKAGSLPHVYFVRDSFRNDRTGSQQAVFSICRNIFGDHGDILSNLDPKNPTKESFRKLIIPAHLKSEIARRLRAMNVTGSALFPGLDGVGRSIDELVRLSAY